VAAAPAAPVAPVPPSGGDPALPPIDPGADEWLEPHATKNNGVMVTMPSSRTIAIVEG
jgi:hypothetical protein